MHIDFSDLIGPSSAKVLLKVLDKAGVGDFKSTISELESFTNSPAWIHHRVQNAEDRINDFWEDHKDDIDETVDSVKGDIGDVWDTIRESVEDACESVASFVTSLF